MKRKLKILLSATLIASIASPVYLNTAYADNNMNKPSVNNENSNDNNQLSRIYFTVDADQTVDMTNNRKKSINIRIKNSSNADAKNVTATASIQNPENVFISGNGIIVNNRSISEGSSASGSITLETTEDFQSQTIPVKINIKYYNGSNFETQDEIIYIRATAQSPSLEIKKVDRMWPDKVQAGQPFPAVFEVKNTGGVTAKNVKLSLEGLENNAITLANGLSTADITNLNPGESQYVYFNLKSQNSTKAGSYMLKLNYKFNASKDSKANPDGSYSFTVDIQKSRNTESILEFSNITFPSNAVGRNKVVNLSFDITNTGKVLADNITVTANSQDISGLTSKSVSSINAKALKPGQKASFSFQFITTPSAETKNYPVDIKVSYTDKNNADEARTINQIVGVFVRAPKEAAPGEKQETSVPKLIIDDYSFDPEIIEAGKPFKMRLRLYNTSASKAVKNIKIFLSSDAQEPVNQGTEGNDNQTGAQSGSASVFTPVNSSNTFYIENIAPNAKVEKEIELTTVPDTAAKTYTVVANFEYEDSKAQKFTSSEQIGIPVVQRAKLEVGEIVPDGEFSVGTETPLSVDFFNTGKATLYNVMVKASGSGLKFDTPSYYKGNFAPGASDNFSCNITPESKGKKTLTLTFSFEDSTGQQHSVIRDYNFDPEDFSAMDEGQEDIQPQPTGIAKKIISGIIAAALIAGGIIFYRKRKQKQKDDNDLEI